MSSDEESNTITITRALNKLKTLDKQINDAITNATFCAVTGQLVKLNFDKGEITKAHQSIIDKINYRSKLKAAIITSNATTHIKINGRDYTVATAIEEKSFIKHRKLLLECMKKQYANCIKNIENTNSIQKQQLENSLHNNKSNSGTTDNVRDKIDLSQYSKNYMDVHGVSLYDEIQILTKIRQHEEYIQNFEAEIDTVLTESNTVTHITVPN